MEIKFNPFNKQNYKILEDQKKEFQNKKILMKSNKKDQILHSKNFKKEILIVQIKIAKN